MADVPDGLGTAMRRIYESGAGGHECSILVAIVHSGAWSNPAAESIISTDELAARLGISRATVVDAMRRLVDAGVVVVRERRGFAAARRIVWDVLDGYTTTTSREGGDRRSASYRTQREGQGDRQPITEGRSAADQVGLTGSRSPGDRQPIRGRSAADQGVISSRSRSSSSPPPPPSSAERRTREPSLSRRRDQSPPTDDELVAWEDAVSAWSELQPLNARQLVVDAGAGRKLLEAMRTQGRDRLVQRLRHAARGTSWHARSVRGEAKGYTRTTAVTELLVGKMAEGLDSAAAAHRDDRPTRADWRTSQRFPTPVDASNTAAEIDTPPAPPPPTPPGLRPVWERALEQLREVVDPEEVTVWLGDASLVELEGGRARIAVRSAYYAEWCAHEYAVLAEILGAPDVEYFAADHVETAARTATV